MFQEALHKRSPDTRIYEWSIPRWEVPDSMNEFIGWLQGVRDAIPKEWQENADVILPREVDEDFCIRYFRPATIEEKEEEIVAQRRQANARRQKELAQLKELKVKYPDEA